ncbi:MAG: hypothetical protein KDK51_03210, partial [Deltaproteobacteria bacterium]|nr:hypothetical protein [Deltaproteobacteria bacterium]
VESFNKQIETLYQNKIFQQIYNSLHFSKLNFLVATFTNLEYKKSINNHDPNHYAPLGIFARPDPAYNRLHPQIGFRLEKGFPMYQYKCGAIDLNSFDHRKINVFQEFTHASQWLYYTTHDLLVEENYFDLLLEIEVELLALITGNVNCINNSLLNVPSIQKLVKRYSQNAPFTEDDLQALEKDLEKIYTMLVNQGPSYKEKYKQEDLKKVKIADFLFLPSVAGSLTH